VLHNVGRLQDAFVSRGHNIFCHDHGSSPVIVRLCDSSEAGNYGQWLENAKMTSTDGRDLSVNRTNGCIFQRTLCSN